MVRGKADAKTLRPALAGVRLSDGKAQALRCEPLRVTRLSTERLGPLRSGCSLVEISVGEGRKHFVKRLLAELNHPVVKLCRVEFGPYKLGALKPGEIQRTRFRSLG